MEMAESLIFDAGWIFFAAWGMILTVIGLIAFGREILRAPETNEGKPRTSS